MASKTKGKTAVKDVEKEKVEESLDDQELESLYAWVDSIPLTRPKKNISRDFSDGVCMAEVIKHFFPNDGLVELHSYSCANSSNGKKENWYLLNRKVFSKLNFELAEEVINDLVQCKPGMIEKVLLMLQVKIKRAEYWRMHHSDKPEADQHQHQMTPGRKDTRMIKVGIDDTKGSRFAKTKHYSVSCPFHGTNADELDSLKEIECELKKKVKFRDEKECKNVKGKRLQERKSPPKNPPKQPTVIPKRRPGPLLESDVVPRYVVEEKEQEILTRDETIQMLQAKVKKLEHLLQLKDMRIREMTEQVGYAQQDHHYGVYHKHSVYN